MNSSEFDYTLPRELIAQFPAPRREDSRLLVVDRGRRDISHLAFRDLPGILRAGDTLVVNESKVIAARLNLRKSGTGGAVEATMLREREGGTWEALLKPSSRLKAGGTLDSADDPPRPVLRIVERLEDGRWVVELDPAAGGLDRVGSAPLPPYIRREGVKHAADDLNRYQTVYARVPGSVAAPTAGLHFEPGMLERLEGGGCEVVRIVLHVGTGTFNPVKTDTVEEHRMDEERFEVSASAAERLARARAEGRRIVAVGTTSVRVLETIALREGGAEGKGIAGSTGLFITPGFSFAMTGAMLTNFHMPRSTPYVLVCALAGFDLMRRAYAEAIDRKYRFLSYGDAMVIV